MRRVLAICVWLALCGAAAFGQSLGDVARQTRQKERAKGKAAKKVITNEDLPETPDLTPGQQETVGKMEPVSPSAPSGTQSAEQWKSRILAQKNQIAGMQAQIDKLSGSIRFVEANAYVNGVQYNQHQVKKQQQVAQMQTQLAEQRQKLAKMQDAAKKAGMGSAVYDP